MCLTAHPCRTLFVLQTGKMGGEAYRAAGITGKGQVCGIADSGLNDLSCFFYDGPSSMSPSSPGSHISAYRGVLTNRSGLIEPLRRKVIQYIAYADMTDELGETAMHCAATTHNAMLHMSRHAVLTVLCRSIPYFSQTASNRLRTLLSLKSIYYFFPSSIFRLIHIIHFLLFSSSTLLLLSL